MADMEERFSAMEMEVQALTVILVGLLGGVAAGNEHPRSVVQAVKEAAQLMVENVNVEAAKDDQAARQSIRDRVSDILDGIQFLEK